ncbi:HAD family hydrolase [Streptomyces sp. NPDC048297]|uniref:HAD family hydrolase n=1 Tax=Streptomyces sp. NPDC048297 TaxID=3365531 RepID=UPI0037193943
MGGAHDQHTMLQRLLRGVDAVLFDFDGPVTDLFRDESTAPVAQEIKDAVRRIWGPLDPDVEECDDSHGVLRRLRDMFDRPSIAHRDLRGLSTAEAIVTRYEYKAVEAAKPVHGLVPLIDALLRLDLRLVIVSNNSDGPVWEFLKNWQMPSKFDHVVGRDPEELRHLKPDPYSVHCALRHLELPAERTLLIGDQLTDLQAAREAGTLFLGHTPSVLHAQEMTRRGADGVVDSHTPLRQAAQTLHNLN